MGSYISFVASTPSSTGRFATDAMQLNNTVTWQFRYDYGSPMNYSTQGARQLMDSLISQMRAVQDSDR